MCASRPPSRSPGMFSLEAPLLLPRVARHLSCREACTHRKSTRLAGLPPRADFVEIQPHPTISKSLKFKQNNVSHAGSSSREKPFMERGRFEISVLISEQVS